MTAVVHQNDIGELVCEPRTLSRRRRRLSTVVMQEPRRKGRAYIVSVHRKADFLVQGEQALHVNDDTIRLRKDWSTSMVGPDDVVVITYLPLGGGGGGGGGGKQIGMAIGMLLLSVVAPMFVGMLGPAFAAGGSLTMLGKIVTMGIVAGVGYFLSRANQPKANKEDDRPVYGVTGGGNVPRPGDRIPVHYGTCWINPDLSQPDYFRYQGTGDGDSEQVLYKRMTVGLGEYDIEAIRVGDSLMWENGDLKEPFSSAEIEVIEPNARSSLVPSGVYSNDLVGGIEVARSNEFPEWSGPFPAVPPGETTKRIQVDWSLPQGLYAVLGGKQGNRGHVYSVTFDYAEIDEDGNVTGSWQRLYRDHRTLQTTRAQRFTKLITVPEGRYAVRAQMSPKNQLVEANGGQTYDMVMWDGLRGYLDKEPRRPHVTELAMKITSGTGTGNVSSFSDIWVRVTRRLPQWNGSTWSAPLPTRKAVWAALDIIRNSGYGLAAADQNIVLDRFLHYAGTLTTWDTFDGTIRGPVPVLEAVNTVLGVIRSEATFNGGVWSIERDEPRSLRKHVVTRRQIIKDTSGAEFDLDLTDGSADVIVEYYSNADPKRRAEQRVTIGAETLTPRRIQMFGVSTHDHAVALARWYAACAYWRREQRHLTMELAGRNLQRNQPALIDTWFLDEATPAGVATRSGNSITLDADVPVPAGAHVMLRNEKGLEWGPVAVESANGRTLNLLASDVTTIGSWTGQTFASLWSRQMRKLPMTALVGTLAVLQTPYIVRTARPDANGHVQISAVIDAPEVWQTLGEALPPAPPIRDVVFNEQHLAPVMTWVRAHVVQKATALTLEWSVGEARGAVGYIIDISYGEGVNEDGAEARWENVHYGPGGQGDHVIDYRPNVDLRVRARAYNALGVISAPIYTATTLFKPTLGGEFMDMLIELQHLQEQVRHDIESISKLGSETLRGALKDLAERVEELAAAAATEAGDSYEARQLIKVAVNDAYAAILEETTLRVSEDEALAQQITTMASQWNSDIEAAITTERTARTSADEALANDITTLSARVDTGGSGVNDDVEAAITAEREARASADSALAQDITVVSTTVDDHSASITQVQQSVDGVRAEFGVAIVIDGQAVGGYRLTGFRRLDGTFESQFGIRGDLVVDGTIWGTKLAASSIITSSAQINNAIITSAHIQNAAITYAKIGTAQIDHLKLTHQAITTSASVAGNCSYASSNGGLPVSIYCRAGGSLVAICSLEGRLAGSGGAGALDIYIDGVRRKTVPVQSLTYQTGDGYDTQIIAVTAQVVVSNPGTGTRSVLARYNRQDVTNATLTVLEFAR